MTPHEKLQAKLDARRLEDWKLTVVRIEVRLGRFYVCWWGGPNRTMEQERPFNNLTQAQQMVEKIFSDMGLV